MEEMGIEIPIEASAVNKESYEKYIAKIKDARDLFARHIFYEMVSDSVLLREIVEDIDRLLKLYSDRFELGYWKFEER